MVGVFGYAQVELSPSWLHLPLPSSCIRSTCKVYPTLKHGATFLNLLAEINIVKDVLGDLRRTKSIWAYGAAGKATDVGECVSNGLLG